MGAVTVRAAQPADFGRIKAVIDEWWGWPVSDMVQRLFLDHFFATSLIAEEPGGALAGFVVGFHSPSVQDLAYIHFTGVAPEQRRTGLARDLYARFFAAARDAGCAKVQAITSPLNEGSIAFHRSVGFSVSEPIPDYDGPGLERVVFTLEL
jgi:ribosomal protein S18 acetylase RimI-like enzyme